jgi:hypothetical protein
MGQGCSTCTATRSARSIRPQGAPGSRIGSLKHHFVLIRGAPVPSLCLIRQRAFLSNQLTNLKVRFFYYKSLFIWTGRINISQSGIPEGRENPDCTGVGFLATMRHIALPSQVNFCFTCHLIYLFEIQYEDYLKLSRHSLKNPDFAIAKLD